MNDLERYFTENDGRLISKWRHYFEIYDRHFSRYRGTAVTVVEVGVFEGGSLQMWKDYFGPAARIYGVDINPDVLQFAEDQIQIIVGDQGDERFLRNLAAQLPQIDILIDDGGHTMRQQRTTLDVMLPLIAPDGVYVCEDLHTSYWREYGGGFRRRSSFIELSKRLVDSLNAWHSHSRRLAVTEFTRSVHGIHFYDSVLVIEKRPMQVPVEVTTGVRCLEPMAPSRAGRIYTRSPRPVQAALDLARPMYDCSRGYMQRIGDRRRGR